MDSLFAQTTTEIWGTRNSWSAAQTGGPSQPKSDCNIDLEIQGDEQNGYHLIMTPTGFFTADSWHETKQDAIDAAFEIFGVSCASWSKRRPTP